MAIVPQLAFPIVRASANVYDRTIERCLCGRGITPESRYRLQASGAAGYCDKRVDMRLHYDDLKSGARVMLKRVVRVAAILFGSILIATVVIVLIEAMGWSIVAVAE